MGIEDNGLRRLGRSEQRESFVKCGVGISEIRENGRCGLEVRDSGMGNAASYSKREPVFEQKLTAEVGTPEEAGTGKTEPFGQSEIRRGSGVDGRDAEKRCESGESCGSCGKHRDESRESCAYWRHKRDGEGCESEKNSESCGRIKHGDGRDKVKKKDLINDGLVKSGHDYLFKRTGEAAAEYVRRHPGSSLINLGIGDVAFPLAPCAAAAAAEAAVGMTTSSGFHGYGPYEGYRSLRNALAGDYRSRGISVLPEEIFITNGAKGELFSLLRLFNPGIRTLLQNPVYPAYADANAIAGNEVVYVEGNEDNGFLPSPREAETGAQLIYICSPNNPTGAVYDRERLSAWVKRALDDGAVIIFDAAYRDYISGNEPASIYEIDGARRCAIEVCSFSKSAAFTGIRCGWTVVPSELCRDGASLGEMYGRLIAVADNGVSYLVQRAACGALSLKSRRYNRRGMDVYRNSAAVLSSALERGGLKTYGGTGSPYIWARCPSGMTSEETFGFLLNNAELVSTPGAGFGSAGEGYFRLSCFCTAETAAAAAGRLSKALGKL